MWSVWSESVELYLGQSLFMIKKRSKEWVIAHPTTLPFGHVLAKLTDTVVQEQMLNKAKRCKLHVTLGGTLCPAVDFDAPQEVRHWEERQSIAQASVAMTMGSNPDQIVCEMDAGRKCLASGVPTWIMQSLQDWAKQQNFHLASVRPLWAVASHSPMAQRSDIHGLIVQEPDAVTLLVDVPGGKFMATTLSGHEEQLPILTRRWLIGQGISEEKLLKLSFAVTSRPFMPQGPTAWPTHWDSP